MRKGKGFIILRFIESINEQNGATHIDVVSDQWRQRFSEILGYNYIQTHIFNSNRHQQNS